MRKYGNAVVMVELQWRLFDKELRQAALPEGHLRQGQEGSRLYPSGKQQVRALADDGR